MNYYKLSFLVLISTFIFASCNTGIQEEEQEMSVGTQEESMNSMETADTEKINLNTASEEEFLTIPDMTDRMVHEFEEYRPYISIVQFRREIGKYVDEEQVAAYEEYVFVPINVNECDAATLLQIPGLDEEGADEIIARRPFTTNNAFLEYLAEFITASDEQIAASYLVSE